VLMWGEEGGRLGIEGCGSGIRLGECSSVGRVRDDIVEGLQSKGFAAAMLGCRGFEAKLLDCGDGKVSIRAGERCVGCFVRVSLYIVDIRLRGRLDVLEVEGSIAGIRKRLGF